MKFNYPLLTLLICSALQSAQYTVSVGQRDYFDTSDGVEATTISDRLQQVIDAAVAAGDRIPILELDTIEGGNVARAVSSLNFSNISGTITAANLKVYAKPLLGRDIPSNDIISIGYSDLLFSTEDSRGILYEYHIGLGSGTGENSYFDFDWDPNNPNLPSSINEGYEINIDLSNFDTVGYWGSPEEKEVNILPQLQNYKALDLYIQDDSTIDYIELTITTDSDPPIVIFSVTALAGENGSVEPSSPVVYYSPTEVTLTATPEDGYVFSNWTGDITDLLSSNNPVTLSVSSDATITANFVASRSANSEGSDRIPQSLVNMIEIFNTTDSGGVITGSSAVLYNSNGTYTGIEFYSENPEYSYAGYSWDPVAARATFPNPDETDSNYYWDYQFQDFENPYVYPYTAVENINPTDSTLEPINYVGLFYDGKADIDNNGKMDLFQMRDGDPFPDQSFSLNPNDLTDLALSLWTNLTVGKVIEYKSYKSTNLDDWELLDTKLVPLDTEQDQVFIKSEVNILE